MRRSPSRGTGHAWIRNNILGLVAIFIALSGTAVAAQVGNHDGATSAKKKKAKAGPRGPAGPQGPAGPATGVAGGDLTGNYPNPEIGPNKVTGTEIADFTIGNVDLATSSVDSAVIANNTVAGVDVNEPTLNIPTAWADVTDAPGAATDPVLTASEGVVSVNDGPGAGADGFFCFELGFTPDLIEVTDQLDGTANTMSAEAPPPLGCVAGEDALAIATGGGNGDMFIAFYDLQ